MSRRPRNLLPSVPDFNSIQNRRGLYCKTSLQLFERVARLETITWTPTSFAETCYEFSAACLPPTVAKKFLFFFPFFFFFRLQNTSRVEADSKGVIRTGSSRKLKDWQRRVARLDAASFMDVCPRENWPSTRTTCRRSWHQENSSIQHSGCSRRAPGLRLPRGHRLTFLSLQRETRNSWAVA